MRRALQIVLLMGSIVVLYTGVAKGLNTGAFRTILEDHALLSQFFIVLAVIFVPVVEIVLGLHGIWVCLSGRRLSRAAMWFALLFAVLTIYSLVLTIQPPPKPTGCGCGFGNGVIHDWWPIVLRNGLVTSFSGVASYFLRSAVQHP